MTAVRTASGAPSAAAPVADRRARGSYRGRDRRTTTGSTGTTTSMLVAAGLLSGLVVTALLFRDVADPDVVDVQRVLLLGVSALVAGLTGVLCLLRRRVTGETPVLWLAAGLLVLAVSRVGALLDVATDPLPPARVTTAVYGAGTLLCVLLVIQALRSPQVDTRFRPVPVLAGTAVAMALVAVFLWVVSLDEPLANLTSEKGAGKPLGALLGLCWMCVAGLAFRRAQRSGDGALTWPGLTALGLSLAALVPVLARWVSGDAARASLLVEAGAMLCALLGIQSALVRTVGDQQAVLFDTKVEAATVAARQRAELQAREERDHDLRSALFAIEGAARTLERHQAALDEGSRHQLARAVASEVVRLQALVRQVDDGPSSTTFAVADVLAPLLALELTAGVDLRVDVPEGLTAVGSPSATTEIIRNLLDNARNHAPGSAVCVTAEECGAEVVVHVADEGPGVPVGERSAIFERGRRGSQALAEGSGLGLFVSARLAGTQGGRLELSSDGGGGGARFSLRLPAPGSDAP
jgi:two-component system OmpR family sensor kinase